MPASSPTPVLPAKWLTSIPSIETGVGTIPIPANKSQNILLTEREFFNILIGQVLTNNASGYTIIMIIEQSRWIGMSSPRAISDIKKDLESFVGSKIRLKANRGRNRIIEREGILESIYPNIFVVKLDERKIERRVSYSYADVLTETVELFVYDTGDEEFRIPSANP
jgi:uncharacterized protein Veg